MTMYKSWTLGVTKELATDITQNYKESVVMRRRLRQLLLDKSEVYAREADSKATYDSPNWAYIQADRVGYARAIREIISLIED